jgi:hypothetical protein
MKKVSDILNRKGASAVAMKPDAKLTEAIIIMTDKNIGSVLVMDGGEYLGIVTERDYTAIYWGFDGDFVDFWDAFLWLVAFFFIELNVVEWRHEEEAESGSSGLASA